MHAQWPHQACCHCTVRLIHKKMLWSSRLEKIVQYAIELFRFFMHENMCGLIDDCQLTVITQAGHQCVRILDRPYQIVAAMHDQCGDSNLL